MATALKHPPAPVVDVVTLTLTQREAQLLRDLVGSTPTHRIDGIDEDAQSIYSALTAIPELHEIKHFFDVELKRTAGDK